MKLYPDPDEGGSMSEFEADRLKSEIGHPDIVSVRIGQRDIEAATARLAAHQARFTY